MTRLKPISTRSRPFPRGRSVPRPGLLSLGEPEASPFPSLLFLLSLSPASLLFFQNPYKTELPSGPASTQDCTAGLDSEQVSTLCCFLWGSNVHPDLQSLTELLAKNILVVMHNHLLSTLFLQPCNPSHQCPPEINPLSLHPNPPKLFPNHSAFSLLSLSRHLSTFRRILLAWSSISGFCSHHSSRQPPEWLSLPASLSPPRTRAQESARQRRRPLSSLGGQGRRRDWC